MNQKTHLFLVKIFKLLVVVVVVGVVVVGVVAGKVKKNNQIQAVWTFKKKKIQ